MSPLAAISSILNEHLTVRNEVKVLRSSVEAFKSAPNDAETLTKNHWNLKQAMANLEEGVLNHYAHEEAALVPLVGSLLSEALRREHGEIIGEIRRTKELLSASPQGLSYDQLLAKSEKIKQIVDNLCRKIEEHSLKEDSVFGLLKQALEKKGGEIG